ncbi:MAG: 2-C-methyl-D-erythritol 2,4-cyclodiphosphate synthase, partial [Malacoplasma sp.]|nr:2-C-methyl-D-erythritol 2,4-cyclodiphosphate synthase [Malacoplasma sp.]
MNKYLIGNSVDIHKIKKENKEIVLGGINFLEDYSIVAHSDGDVIFHAVSEAILGALALGDLGDYFSDACSQNKNMNSKIILDYVLNIMNKKKYHISNIDITVISEHIIIKENKHLIKDNLI